MRSLIIAYPEHDMAHKIRLAMQSRGLPVQGIALSGSQVLQIASLCEDGGVIVCPFRFPDLSSNEIMHLLPDTFDMLVLVTARQLSSVYGTGIYTLAQPFTASDVVDAAAGLLRDRHPTGLAQPTETVFYHRNRLGPAPDDKAAHGRSNNEQQIIALAKELLMNRKHMSEPEAHRFLQKRSMESGIRIVELAQRLLQ
ncbi:MAG: ANTAR domain-containing protein [Eubacteriales bacterium]|nr:ANTAR domain-containing protein [Eubacteriales bacterium]